AVPGASYFVSTRATARTPTKHPALRLRGGRRTPLVRYRSLASMCSFPELIILDEPTTGVDPVSRRDFWNILAQLIQEKGITALVSTAYLDEAARFHHISLVLGGKVLAQGEPQEIAHLTPGRIVALHSTQQLETLERLREHFPQVESLGSWIRSFVDENDDAAAISRIKGVLGALPVDDIHVSEPELEDVFITLLRQRSAAQPQSPGDTPPSPSQWTHNAQQGAATQGQHHTIEALDLSKDFGRFRAVEQASFRVPQGEIFGLLGANGAGKTTVIKMLTGILRPNSGVGRVAGVDMRRAGQRIKGRIGYMSQAFSLYLDLTVLENINLYAGIYGLSGNEKRQRTAWVVKMAGLSSHETDRASSLPIGLRQRLELGCALVHRPQVLFLDEPTSGVDPLGRRRF
ncbi:MAG: ATP-binding cassette domain-containing protein, partial [Gammaproteobacteria bacterium]|nr:ATP-binding cassette domain-containing protein [Gammaproteobacteria bacterium]